MIIDTEFNSAAQIPSQICIEAATLAEERGFGCIWKGESNSRDPMVLLSAMAMATSKVHLGTAIYHVYGRSPVSLAMQAATLNELSGNRLILGLGIANPVIAGWHGDTYEKPLRGLREYIEILRAAYSGERVPDFQGMYHSTRGAFRLAFTPPSEPLRLWIAGLGPQMARLAGKLSDGIIINLANPKMIRQVVADFRAGAREAGRDPDRLDVVSKVRVALADDPQQAYWTLKKVLTFYSLQSGYSDMLAKMGWGEVVDQVQAAHREEGFTAARRLIPDAMVDDVPMYAARDLERLPAKIAEYAEAGATRCVVAYVPVGDDLRGELRTFLDSAVSHHLVGGGAA
ncbi:MAG TPA: LLM class flavin-dependent oxidoreductase [Candidatus Dormibacteraeota bacterium]|nr:LLM class flavin-dependent oxidoreductase [Candidatus Dormibacteraeota bacterium]